MTAAKIGKICLSIAAVSGIILIASLYLTGSGIGSIVGVPLLLTILVIGAITGSIAVISGITVGGAKLDETIYTKKLEMLDGEINNFQRLFMEFESDGNE